ncbi:reductase [Novimethylophilus kurashikiensis]|uniref:Reductase n=1 Tax=Novimethylophilus kurashikiensis TaxID=1825523 RepID=A0A2R5FCN3_9PROT|nr:hypothetical protein [Novimethylophilus kurashikiensis]GBG14471.1 reductase [Novimethylophilus kurashikiensis]
MTNPTIALAYDLPDYRGSKDYARLAALARRSSVVCILDYRVRDIDTRDVARTQYMSKGYQECWSVCSRGTSYITVFSQADFISLCEHYNLEFFEPPAAHQPAEADDGCICKGNWRAIVKEVEPLINKKFRDSDGKEHIFFGVVHGSDDYYYGMYPLDGGSAVLLSCVGSIAGFGYELVES